ncbi:MAG: hypothetical protein FJ104_06610 [Deltaproteobacteria bacterium]|nr:hypothetical protein [Deltaproteobacteria bacterium]
MSAPCPPVIPNFGSPCDSSGPSECRYGGCGIPNNKIARCQSGRWAWQDVRCE